MTVRVSSLLFISLAHGHGPPSGLWMSAAEMSPIHHTAGHGHTRSHLFLVMKTIKQHDNLKRLVRTKSEHSYTGQGQGMLPGPGQQNKHFLSLQPHPFTRVQEQAPALVAALESNILFLFLVSQVLNYKIMPLCEIKECLLYSPLVSDYPVFLAEDTGLLSSQGTKHPQQEGELTFKGSFSEASPVLSLVLYLRSLSRWSMVEYPSEEKTQQSGRKQKQEQKQSWCKQNSSAKE